jgi:steroid 5-alpha reductase family enzyme
MLDWRLYFEGFAIIAGLALVGWAVGTARRNVTIVDSLWGLFFLAATLFYVDGQWTPRATLIAALVAIWAFRLAGYLTMRSWGEHEDARYRKIRAANEPGFAWKSLYIIFGLQALLAWIISLPLFVAAQSATALSWLDATGYTLWLAGFLLETTADLQMARFKADPANRGVVMDRGVWRYSRHPNYFGECCLWWGYYLIALAAGGWWSLVSPLIMTFLLLKVSGVALLEKDIVERRPAYADYIARTPAFFPGRPRSRSASGGSR